VSVCTNRLELVSDFGLSVHANEQINNIRTEKFFIKMTHNVPGFAFVVEFEKLSARYRS
jgi:hypothetical protein